MEMTKAHWHAEGGNIRLTMPLTKVDSENRLVSGWATLDNEDSQGDIVLAEANVDAFSRARGNIREMHQPIAAGRLVNFKEDTYYDPASGQVYRGIYVDVYVSKGAQDTWEKVLDGTLSGFSIGGEIRDYENAIVNGRAVRVIKAYDLVELSLVDNPANQLANIFSIEKSATGTLMKGMLAEVKVENIFWCGTDELIIASAEEERNCPTCSTSMENIGWVEDADPDKVEKIRAAYDKVRNGNPSNDEATEIIKADALEGGNMAENSEVLEKAEGVEEVAEVEETVAAVEETEAVAEEAAESEEVEAVEAAAEVSEVEAEEPDFAKMLGDIQTAIETGLAKNREETTAALTDAVAKFDGQVEELRKMHSDLSEKVAAMSAKAEEVEKALAAVEDETAVKKSGDLGGSSEDGLEKSRSPQWGGRFLSTSDLN